MPWRVQKPLNRQSLILHTPLKHLWKHEAPQLHAYQKPMPIPSEVYDSTCTRGRARTFANNCNREWRDIQVSSRNSRPLQAGTAKGATPWQWHSLVATASTVTSIGNTSGSRVCTVPEDKHIPAQLGETSMSNKHLAGLASHRNMRREKYQYRNSWSAASLHHHHERVVLESFVIIAKRQP